MQHALGWSALTAGTMSAANTAGYLLGAIGANRVLARLGERPAVLGSLLIAATAVFGCAATSLLPVLLALRLIGGMAAAVAFIAGAVILMRAAEGTAPRAASRFLGMYFGGPGLGVALSAPLITPVATVNRWRTSWLLLGAACAACLLITLLALRRVSAGATGPPAKAHREPWDKRTIAPLLVSYGLFGAGYIAFMTFVVAYLRTTRHMATGQTILFWFILGAVGLIVGITAMARVGQTRGGRGMALLVGITALASLLPLLSATPALALLAAALFGAFFSVTAAATTAAQRQLPTRQWPAAIAGLTVAFGLGQCLGPILSGAISDGSQGLRAGLLTGTALLTVSAGCALLQKANTTGGRDSSGSRG